MDSWKWAGVPFMPLYHHDIRMIRLPGLYAYVRRFSDNNRSILYVDHSDCIATDAYLSTQWNEAIGLRMNEVQVCLTAKERIDRLILKAHIIKREEPLLNLLQQEKEPLQNQIGIGNTLKRHGSAY